MQINNIECKAKVTNLAKLEQKLLTLNPRLVGTDAQTDTYFNTPKGRLKLRQGNIENSLIYYERGDTATTKASNGMVYNHAASTALLQLLTLAHGIKVTVNKVRTIYFINNVKFHFDTLTTLGTFVEIEVLAAPNITEAQQQITANYYCNFLELQPSQYIAQSYSDMLLSKFT